MSKEYYVYILASRPNGAIYIGVTNDLMRRVEEHKDGLASKHTKKYRIGRLIYYEIYDRIDEAIAREKKLKKWNRAWKLRLIEERNPEWNDLARPH